MPRKCSWLGKTNDFLSRPFWFIFFALTSWKWWVEILMISLVYSKRVSVRNNLLHSVYETTHCFLGSSIPVFFWILVNLVFLGLLTFAPKISTDVLFAPVMHRSWEEKSSDYDTTSHCLSAWMLYTLEQSQPQCSQTSTYVMKKWYAVEVKNLNLHILIKTLIFLAEIVGLSILWNMGNLNQI